MIGKSSKGNKKKGRKKKAIACVVTVAVLGTAGSVVYSRAQKQTGEKSESREAKSAEVTVGNIANTIVGTGNLELEEAKSVTIPSGLTVSEVYVESGDQVFAGTPLASVDPSSVLSAVKNIQEEMNELDADISECQDDSTANTVTATVSGRIKAIYVAADSEVTDVMLDKGALLELSLDGLMAVKIENTADVSTGEEVSVVLSDGSTISGTVESQEENSCVVTMTDDGTIPGDSVTVKDSEDNVLGSGNLYIHEAFEVTGTTGTVASVSVSENEKVTAGEELLILNGAESDSEYEELIATREARAETLKKLLSLIKNPQITAEWDGTVQDVNVSASQTTGNETSSGNTSSETSGNVGISQMSYTRIIKEKEQSNGASWALLSFDDGSEIETQESSETENSAEGSENADEKPEMDVADTELTFSIINEGNSDSTHAVISAPVRGETPITEINASDGSYKGIVTWNPNASIFASDTAYQALVLLSASDGFCFGANSIQGTEIGTVSGIQVTDNGKTLEFQIAFPETAAEEQKESGNNTGGTTDSNVSTTVDGGTGNSESTVNNNSTGKNSQNNSGGQNDSESMSLENAGGSGQSTASGAGGTATQQSGDNSTSSESTSKTDASQYSTDVTAFTVSPDENMRLSVSVDELDINSVEEGQTAVVTFDAIEEKEFEGKVTKIGNSASVNGGVAKYTVEITIPKDDEMKQGMNASATITTEERDQVLTLPMNALQEKGEKTFVYTKQETDGTLSGETEIQTGLTDGNTVEITEGLEEGDTVYYTRTESNTSSSGNTDIPDMTDRGPDGNMPDQSGFGRGGTNGKTGGNPGDSSGGGPGGGQDGPGM